MVIKLFGDKDMGGEFSRWNETKRISIQRIVHPLVECYQTGRRILKELAIDALFNMGKSSEQYLEILVTTPIYNSIIENISTSYQPLLWKSMRCFLQLIKWDINCGLILEENPDIFEKLMFCTVSKDQESNSFKNKVIRGAEYNIQIKIYAMKILFMFIKKVKDSKQLVAKICKLR